MSSLKISQSRLRLVAQSRNTSLRNIFDDEKHNLKFLRTFDDILENFQCNSTFSINFLVKFQIFLKKLENVVDQKF